MLPRSVVGQGGRGTGTIRESQINRWGINEGKVKLTSGTYLRGKINSRGITSGGSPGTKGELSLGSPGYKCLITAREGGNFALELPALGIASFS